MLHTGIQKRRKGGAITYHCLAEAENCQYYNLHHLLNIAAVFIFQYLKNSSFLCWLLKPTVGVSQSQFTD